MQTQTKIVSDNKTPVVDNESRETGGIIRYGVEWSNDGVHWLAIVNDKSLPEAHTHFRANTANYKRLVKHVITKTILDAKP